MHYYLWLGLVKYLDEKLEMGIVKIPRILNHVRWVLNNISFFGMK